MKKQEKTFKCCGDIKMENPLIHNNTTELVFILDRSGSMYGLEADTVGGFNSMIEKQKHREGCVIVSTVLFNSTSEVIHDRIDINEIHPMTPNEYEPSGCTALYDAIGNAIHHIGNVHKYAPPEYVPEHTLFIITTDGMENASQHYSASEIKSMIKRQSERYGWEFIFLAANIDAFETAQSIGIKKERAGNYTQSSRGIEKSFYAMNEAIICVREDCADSMDIKEYLED